MEFPGTGYSPGPSPQSRGESRRLRRERDNAKTRLFRCLFRRFIWSNPQHLECDRYSAHCDEPQQTLNLFTITCQGNTQAR
jgi:hypothetical protein